MYGGCYWEVGKELRIFWVVFYFWVYEEGLLGSFMLECFYDLFVCVGYVF